MNDKPRVRVLFLCTGNSCRSQMAEGWTRHLKGDAVEVFSAGAETHGLNPRAVHVMAEAGIDISMQKSKHIGELPVRDFDYVVTLCDSAREACPFFPGAGKMVHMKFDDPPALCSSDMEEEECLDQYRRVRDQIREFVQHLPEILERTREEP